jgi:hypothetical protein
MRADLRTKGTLATEIRDNIESYCQGQQYSAFLNHLVPVFLKILDGAPVFISTSPEQVSAHCLYKLRSNNRNSEYETASSKSSIGYPWHLLRRSNPTRRRLWTSSWAW